MSLASAAPPAERSVSGDGIWPGAAEKQNDYSNNDLTYHTFSCTVLHIIQSPRKEMLICQRYKPRENQLPWNNTKISRRL